jgi:Tol biopolymer transport system component
MMVIVSAGFLIQLQPVSATFPGANGKIVFSRNIGAAAPDYEIFTVNPDGSGLTQLTSTPDNVMAHWSADGARIVFASDRDTPADADGNSEIWIMNADGSGQNQITYTTLPIENGFPAFSPDGSKIVFSREDPGGENIWVMNVDGSNPQPLTNTGKDTAPVWSPDGSKIAFTSTRTGDEEIYVMNVDSSGQTDISNNPATDYVPEWSPDGKMIAFISDRNGGIKSIWVMNADGSNPMQLSNPANGLSDAYPAWSPDGTKIAFTRAPAPHNVWVMNADGTNPVDITLGQSHSDTDIFTNWQPLFPNPVGGVVLPTSKLEIVAPFAALAGLIVAVSAVVAVKKRRD